MKAERKEECLLPSRTEAVPVWEGSPGCAGGWCDGVNIGQEPTERLHSLWDYFHFQCCDPDLSLFPLIFSICLRFTCLLLSPHLFSVCLSSWAHFSTSWLTEFSLDTLFKGMVWLLFTNLDSQTWLPGTEKLLSIKILASIYKQVRQLLVKISEQ